MIQSRDSARFFLKSLAVFAFESLDSHDPVQTRVSRFPHFAHSSATDL
jgi:hypothetical protein